MRHRTDVGRAGVWGDGSFRLLWLGQTTPEVPRCSRTTTLYGLIRRVRIPRNGVEQLVQMRRFWDTGAVTYKHPPARLGYSTAVPR